MICIFPVSAERFSMAAAAAPVPVVAVLETGARGRGKRLKVDGFVFQHNRALKNKHTWRCQLHKDGCKYEMQLNCTCTI